MSDSKTPSDPNDKYKPLFTLCSGLFLIILGAGLFSYISSVEAPGVNIQMQPLIQLVYQFLGKYGILGVLGGLGSLIALKGLFDIRNKASNLLPPQMSKDK